MIPKHPNQPGSPVLEFGRSRVSVKQHLQVYRESLGTPASVTLLARLCKGELLDPILAVSEGLSEDCFDAIDDWARAEAGLAPDATLFKDLRKDSPAKKLDREIRLDLLAESLDFQLSWLRDCEDPDNTGWIHGAVESAAHQAACCICQWFGIDGVPTSDTCEALALHTFPERGVLRKSLALYVEECEASR